MEFKCGWKLQYQLYLTMYYYPILKRRLNHISGFQPYDGAMASCLHKTYKHFHPKMHIRLKKGRMNCFVWSNRGDSEVSKKQWMIFNYLTPASSKTPFLWMEILNVSITTLPISGYPYLHSVSQKKYTTEQTEAKLREV